LPESAERSQFQRLHAGSVLRYQGVQCGRVCAVVLKHAAQNMNEIADAEIVVIGGGAIGCGAAYALAKAGKTDMLLLERASDVGQATTAQGAGLCGQARDSVERTRLAMHSVAVFRELQKDSAVKPDWNEVGSLRLALNEESAGEFHRLK